MLSQVRKPDYYSINGWRRVQVQKYIAEKPNTKGKEVLKWILGQKINPQPKANVRGLYQLIKRLCSSARNAEKENRSMPDADSELQPAEAQDGDANPLSEIYKH